MENASKALIIAGAILVSILIIGLGMMIFNNAKDATDTSSLTTQQITTYNSTFDAYVGEKVGGSNVKALYEAVKNHNLANSTDDSLIISINDKTEASDLTSARSSIKTGKTYKVSAEYDTNTGYINKITIVEN